MSINQIGGAFGAPLLGTALVVIYGFYRTPGQETGVGLFPSLPEYRSGLPKRFQATALQRLRRSDFGYPLLQCFGEPQLVMALRRRQKITLEFLLPLLGEGASQIVVYQLILFNN